MECSPASLSLKQVAWIFCAQATIKSCLRTAAETSHSPPALTSIHMTTRVQVITGRYTVKPATRSWVNWLDQSRPQAARRFGGWRMLGSRRPTWDYSRRWPPGTTSDDRPCGLESGLRQTVGSRHLCGYGLFRCPPVTTVSQSIKGFVNGEVLLPPCDKAAKHALNRPERLHCRSY